MITRLTLKLAPRELDILINATSQALLVAGPAVKDHRQLLDRLIACRRRIEDGTCVVCGRQAKMTEPGGEPRCGYHKPDFQPRRRP